MQLLVIFLRLLWHALHHWTSKNTTDIIISNILLDMSYVAGKQVLGVNTGKNSRMHEICQVYSGFIKRKEESTLSK